MNMKRFVAHLMDAVLRLRKRKEIVLRTVFKPTRCVVVGLGGTGSHLTDTLCQFMAHHRAPLKVVLVEGKDFTQRNQERQRFYQIGINKAVAARAQLLVRFPNLAIEVVHRYVTDKNVGLIIQEGDLVFGCVDNHSTRKTLATRMSGMKDGVLISGGNELVDGNVHFNIRCDGVDLTPPITHLHPEIDEPKDRNPVLIGCTEQVVHKPQIIFVNALVANLMLGAFWNILKWTEGETGLPVYTEQFFDVTTGFVRSCNRNETVGKKKKNV